MNELVQQGKKSTLIISIGVLIASLSNVYLYHLFNPEVGVFTIIWQVIQLLFMLSVLAEAFKGKRWAKIVVMILCFLSAFGSLWTGFTLESSILLKLPFLTFVIIYGMAFFHFGFSKSYKAFSEFNKRFDFDQL